MWAKTGKRSIELQSLRKKQSMDSVPRNLFLVYGTVFTIRLTTQK